MIPISTALQTALEQPAQTISTCWKVTLTSGTVLGFTDHDSDIDFDGVTYEASTGYTRSDIASGADLSVDNLELVGTLRSPAITEAALYAGVWDFAQVEIFAVNYEDLTQGALVLRVGWLGEVSVGRNNFTAEIRGLTQAYSRVIGELTGPGCRNDLGDSRCQVDLAPFTFAFTVTGVGADNQTVYASALTQPGPTGGVSLVSVKQANPGVATVSPSLVLPTGSPITISGAGGMTQINTDTTYNNPNGDHTQFQLSIDTSGFPAYTGGGTVTALGGSAGYFDGGVVTWLSGNNFDGGATRMEVKSYSPGQFILVLPMPYAIQVGDTGSIVGGCNKAVATCHDTFDNVINFRGEPYLPGVDRLLQVGKQNG